jgi:hypothetical protein
MEKRYYTSTNWAPWLGFAFAVSPFFLAFVSNGWLLAFLIFLSFLPAIAVGLTLRGYFLLENNQIKYCYDRKNGRETDIAISLIDVTQIHRVGKSVAISFDRDDNITKRIHDTEAFIKDIMERNPRIELV